MAAGRGTAVTCSSASGGPETSTATAAVPAGGASITANWLLVPVADQAVPLRLRQEGADAVVEVRAREPVQVLDQVRQRFIEPPFLLEMRPEGRAASNGGGEGLGAEGDGVCVLVGQHGPQVRPGL